MTSNKQGVQRVLDYHNKKYGTHIVICGKTQNIYPDLQGKSDWDFVCRDTKRCEEISLEVKNFTDEKLEVRRNTIRDILKEIGGDLSNKLPGIFGLDISIYSRSYLPLKGKQGKQNKQKFKDVLCEAVLKTAQTLNLGEHSDLIPQISGKLPFALPDAFSCTLSKCSDEGSGIGVSAPGGLGEWSLKLNESELEKLEKLVSDANKKPRLANVKETFLVIIEGRLSTADFSAIPEAFKSISHNSYSHVNHAYSVSGEEVIEISLPTP